MDRMDAKMQRYQDALRRRRKSQGTIGKYVGVIRRGLRCGDMLEPVRAATRYASWCVAVAAVRWWCQIHGHPTIAAKLEKIPPPGPPSPKRKYRLDERLRAKIAGMLEQHHNPGLRDVTLLFVWSGLRRGTILDMTLEQAQRIRDDGYADEGRDRIMMPSGALEVLDRMVSEGGFERVHQLATRRGPRGAERAVYRLIERTCRELGTARITPYEFRRLVLDEQKEKK